MDFYDKYLKYKYKYLQLNNSYNLSSLNNDYKYESKNICSAYKEHSDKYYEYIFGIEYNKYNNKYNNQYNNLYLFTLC